jgi:hypothetical protein
LPECKEYCEGDWAISFTDDVPRSGAGAYFWNHQLLPNPTEEEGSLYPNAGPQMAGNAMGRLIGVFRQLGASD